MAKGKVYFIELAVAQKEKYVCDIVEKLYLLHKKVHVFTALPKTAAHLDQLLWSWKQDSFIPHGILRESEEETVTILNGQAPDEAADALILFDPQEEAHISSYHLIVDFAELYDKQRLAASRQRYKAVRDSGKYEVYFLKLGAFLQQEL